MKRWISYRQVARRVVPVLVLMALAWPVVGAAQEPPSLVELARQEQARRKAVKGTTKVYTDKDVKRTAPAQGTAAPASSTPAAPAPSSPFSPSPAAPDAQAPPAQAEQSGKDETWWKSRMNQAREDLRRNEAFAEALQSRVNGLTTEFVGRDDPYQRAKIGEDRQKAIAELDRVKAEIEQAKKQIADIEEEARRAGVPPGWIR
jgi:hypothetical protein